MQNIAKLQCQKINPHCIYMGKALLKCMVGQHDTTPSSVQGNSNTVEDNSLQWFHECVAADSLEWSDDDGSETDDCRSFSRDWRSVCVLVAIFLAQPEITVCNYYRLVIVIALLFNYYSSESAHYFNKSDVIEIQY